MSLKALLIDRIATQGPLPLSDYMADALLHPELGYYTSQNPFGADGDFITAPEISQMFGELIGLSLAQAWIDQGKQEPFALVELGPGRGTLMVDALRATQTVPGFLDAAVVVLVEGAPALREVQAQTLDRFAVSWCDAVAELPQMPLFFIANEFFDALPIRQFLRDGAGWRERCIGAEAGGLTYGLGPQGPVAALTHRLKDTQDGDLVEICPQGTHIAAQLGQHIAAKGGAGLIIDYGDWRSMGSTLQALKGHAPTDPLDAPGTADLTAHVDFEALARAAAPAKYTRLTPQGVFLERLGITQRAEVLAQSLDPETLDIHIAAHRRLTHPEEMGTLFKVLGIYPADAAPPPGLSA